MHLKHLSFLLLPLSVFLSFFLSFFLSLFGVGVGGGAGGGEVSVVVCFDCHIDVDVDNVRRRELVNVYGIYRCIIIIIIVDCILILITDSGRYRTDFLYTLKRSTQKCLESMKKRACIIRVFKLLLFAY